jgi:ribosomal protein L12E/L44/L45/RPP1/RPP2
MQRTGINARIQDEHSCSGGCFSEKKSRQVEKEEEEKEEEEEEEEEAGQGGN